MEENAVVTAAILLVCISINIDYCIGVGGDERRKDNVLPESTNSLCDNRGPNLHYNEPPL